MRARRSCLSLLLGGALAWASTSLAAAQVPGPVAAAPADGHGPVAPAGADAGAGPAAAGVPFRVGERLEYDLYFRRHRAGRVALTVEGRETVDGIPAYRVTLAIEGGAFFFRIDDRKVSWIALRPFRSVRFEEHLREGRDESRRTVDLDHRAGTFRESRPTEGGKASTRTGRLPEGAVDELAFFYLLRTLPLEAGDRLELDRFYETEDNPIVVGVEGRRDVDTPGGSYRTLVVRPVLPGIAALAEDADAEVLLSDDERRIVVQVRSRTRLGDVTLRLRSYREGHGVADGAPPARHGGAEGPGGGPSEP